MTQKKIVTPIRKVDKSKREASPPQVELVEEAPVPRKPGRDFRDYLNVFEFECTLPGSGETIKFKPLSIKILKKLLTFEDVDETSGKITEIFDDIFKRSVLNEDFDPTRLYLFDRFALLLEIRKKTKGETSAYNMACPECKSQSQQSIDFENIKFTKMPVDIDPIVKITDQLSVKMRYIRRSHEKECYDKLKELSALNEFNDDEKEAELGLLIESQTIDQIITPDGPQENVTIWDKKYLLEEIPQPLYRKVTGWHDTYKFGPELTLKVECPHCKFESEQDVTELDFF